MLSICTTVKNRSRLEVGGRELVLFPNCVNSIVQAVDSDIACELVVTDWESDDWPLDDWLEEAAEPLPIQIVPMHGGFSRGKGLNVAAQAAQGEFLLFLDADVLISRELIATGLEYIRTGKAFFPIIFSFKDWDHQDGWWRETGFGHVMLTRNVFYAAGTWPEYASWGQEDEDFHAKVSDIVPVVRERVEGLCHQWHPNDVDWKNQYGDEPPRLGHDCEQIQLAKQELANVIPENAPFIFVDDAKFGQHTGPLERAIPFLERNGEYWGAPNDDATAIDEFKRLRSNGAQFIAFAWQAFWWLEYYSRFLRYVQENSRHAFENERLTIFDLRVSRVSENLCKSKE